MLNHYLKGRRSVSWVSLKKLADQIRDPEPISRRDVSNFQFVVQLLQDHHHIIQCPFLESMTFPNTCKYASLVATEQRPACHHFEGHKSEGEEVHRGLLNDSDIILQWNVLRWVGAWR